MAVIVDYVDEISRQLKRDVLWFYFDPDHYDPLDDWGAQRHNDRQEVIDYLATINVAWTPTYGIFNGVWHDGDAEHFYLEIPHAPDSELFQKIDTKYCITENDEERPAIPGVCFSLLTYQFALDNTDVYEDAGEM
jgi:hypothetical protein